MIQYLELLKAIKEKGTIKPAAREGMPGTTSLFGYQFRHDLKNGFPLLTTKKMFWKGIVVELLWFLRGDTNIKYLIDNGVRIWDEDAHNYYTRRLSLYNNKQRDLKPDYHDLMPLNFDTFIEGVNNKDSYGKVFGDDYRYGDCGFQYGRVFRNWDCGVTMVTSGDGLVAGHKSKDQIKLSIERLKKSPESRRHIVTAIDPAHEDDLALYWCHAMFQFNCRPISLVDRKNIFENGKIEWEAIPDHTKYLDEKNVPKYYLDCQLYQRSADVFLGVPFNIASYGLLTHIIAKICNMVPSELICTYGDVHIYDNHIEQVNEQLIRTPDKLPQLSYSLSGEGLFRLMKNDNNFDSLISELKHSDFRMNDYIPQESIKAELSTGLKK